MTTITGAVTWDRSAINYFRAIADEPTRSELKITGDPEAIRLLYEGLTGGTIVPVDRARFERLREYVAAVEDDGRIREAWRNLEVDNDTSVASWERVLRARESLLPTDTDPLTE